MMVSVYFLMFLSVGVGVLFALAFAWATKHNQFKDIEEPKYRMMQDDEEGNSDGHRN